MTSSSYSSRRSSSRRLPTPSNLLLLLPILFLLLLLSQPTPISGDASAPLLGNRYTPTTDVSSITSLSSLLDAIALNDSYEKGKELYAKSAPNMDAFSLESITYDASATADGGGEGGDGNGDGSVTKSGMYLDYKTNPLYSIYMYALYRSPHGSGKDRTSSSPLGRSSMTFLSQPVNYYGHTIISDEFGKTSGYDATLTAETIRVVNVWMAVVQSLYNAVELCDEGVDPKWEEVGGGMNPVDMAAAFWFGNHNGGDPADLVSDIVVGSDGSDAGTAENAFQGNGTLYAWANRARSNFEFGEAPSGGFDANSEILSALLTLQTTLPLCWDESISQEDIDTPEELSKQVRMMVDDVVRYMTVPLVQSLIHKCVSVVMEGNEEAHSNDDIDYIILYGLVTIPPIIICDETVFKDLYEILVTEEKVKGLTTERLYTVLNSLYSRLLCLGITCDYLGQSKLLKDVPPPGENSDWPMCSDPTSDFKTYAGSNPNELLENLKLDLDIRTIGTLIEMEAPTAAYDVYHWGRFVKRDKAGIVDNMNGSGGGMGVGGMTPTSPTTTSTYFSMQDMALQSKHPNNEVGQSYDTKFGFTNFEDLHEYHAVMGLEKFDGTSTPTQRRIITEVSLVAITLHTYALNNLYEALDNCEIGEGAAEWDKAFGAVSGWAEEDESASGFLFMEIARFLCTEAGTCQTITSNQDGTPFETDSPVNIKLKTAFQNGKDALENGDCVMAKGEVEVIEQLLQTILVDATAYFAQKIDVDNSNEDNLAEGYGIATALIPIMWTEDPTQADIVELNMGTWNRDTSEPFNRGNVFTALATFVETAALDCADLTVNIGGTCGGGANGLGTSPTESVTSPTEPSDGGPTGTGLTSPTTPPASLPTSAPLPPTDAVLGIDIDEKFEGGTSSDIPYCGMGTDGGVPTKEGDNMMGGKTGSYASLMRGAYTPTSNVDHLVKLTTDIDSISKAGTYGTGLRYYSEIYDQTSLKCLSTGNRWTHITTSNPLYVTYMYGLWVSDDGDNDSDGFSNKKFDGGDILEYGDTIVMDEFNKKSGFDNKLTAETIRVVNVWMAMATELYRASTSCRDGYVTQSPAGFNPVDHAAALWYGDQDDPEESDGASLYAWAKWTEAKFADGMRVTEQIQGKLSELQQKFEDCRSTPKDQQEQLGVQMKHRADEMTRLMVVPMVRYFIHHLATESGLTDDEPTDERNYMVLYSLVVLPFLSICDEETFDELFTDLIMEIDEYDSQDFTDNLQWIQDRYACLGITCDTVGTSVHDDGSWVECVDRDASNTMINDYQPTSDKAVEMLKIDLDISTILSFIIMEANEAALDIYEFGRNAKDIDTSASISLKDIGIPQTHPEAMQLYNQFTSPTNYAKVTEDAIMGRGAFLWSDVLKNSAAASLAIATIDMHMNVLNNMYQAVTVCSDMMADPSATVIPNEAAEAMSVYWDSALAGVVGWTQDDDEDEESGYNMDGYLFWQLADELCEHFDNCEDDGGSIINYALISQFKQGQTFINNGQCDDLKNTQFEIERLLQTILVDNLAYHAIFSDSTQKDDRHCLMAHVSASALLPLIKTHTTSTVSLGAAERIEANVVAEENSCLVDDPDAVYQALNDYVEFKEIKCSYLGSSVCSDTAVATPSDVDYEDNIGYADAPNDHPAFFNGEYKPVADVQGEYDALKAAISGICDAVDKDAAKNAYLNDDTGGVLTGKITLKEMGTTATYVMSDELQFSQYVYALNDGVDKTDGELLFDSEPAGQYAHTITNDALDTSSTLGCQSVKVMNVWMWIVHKLNTMIDECKDPVVATNFGLVDEAAAMWEASQLYNMAEKLGPSFGHSSEGGMTFLNRKILDRLQKAQGIISSSTPARNMCNNNEVHDLRLIVKETVSYMTAVLIQSFIDSMLVDEAEKEKQEMVELMAFANLPRIQTCGHETVYKTFYDDLISGGFKEDMVGDVVTTLQSHYNCLGLTCDDVGRHNKDTEKHPECSDNLDIAGYTPVNATKTNWIAKLDLDAVAIHQLTSIGKYDLAKRIYEEGHNYYDYDSEVDYNFVSLYNMTKSQTINDSDFPIYKLYDAYFQTTELGSDYANNLINQALDGTGPFETATAIQRARAVDSAISSMVSYMSALEALYFAAKECEVSMKASQTAYDGAVALLIGSVEGRGRGGSGYQEGKMFFGMAKRNCQHFRNCQGPDAHVGSLQFALQEGQIMIKDGKCEEFSDKGVEVLNRILKAPLIESLLFFSDMTSSQSPTGDAAAYVETMAVLPIINDIDPDSASKIKSAISFPSSGITSASKQDTVQTALSVVFSKPESDQVVDCNIVTNIDEICNKIMIGGGDDGDLNTPGIVEPGMPGVGEEDIPPVIEPEEPMPISNGLYVSTNYVGDRTAIARDVAQIRAFLNENDVEGAKILYKNGLNSKIYDDNGMWKDKLVRSIGRFSTESGTTMKSDPTYNLFVYGLADENNEFMGRPATLYADSFITNLLFHNSPEASSAMVAITIWMQVAHSLHAAHASCKTAGLTDGRTIDSRNLQDGGPALHLDEAAAYWIGDNQDTGSSSNGHLLYALTELIGEKFEDLPPGVESNINTRIIDLFNKAKNHIAISRGCSTSEDSHLKLKGVIDEIIPLMAVPLLRGLLFYLNNDNPVMVKVFAVAVLPLFSACAPATYYELKDELIDHDVGFIQKDYIYSKIQSLYSCLGLSCDTVGFMQDSGSSGCDEKSELKSLAGYKYATDADIVDRASRIDVEMRKIEIFIENGMNHFSTSQESLFGTAYDLYRFGEQPNGAKISSLRSIARDTNRDVVPVFASFRNYFGTDAYYADTMIANAFQKVGVFANATADQRKRFIVFALKYMVTHMAILEKLYNAAQSCKLEDRLSEGSEDLDVAAAYFVGSLEGKDDGGSFDGSLIHMLAKRMCIHFGTCTSSNRARINERIISLFYAGQGELETGACEPLWRTVKEIENALIVPLIQGVLFSARQNELSFNTLSVQEFYPEGFALAQSIIPIINSKDSSAAANIKNVMVASFPDQATDTGSNDSDKVHRALKSAVSKMEGVDCSELGSLGGYGFCEGDGASLSSASTSAVSYLVALVITGMTLFALF